jgi:hypothetical protein
MTPVALSDLNDVREYQQFANSGVGGMEGVESNVLARAVEGAGSYLNEYVRDAIIPFVGGPTTGSALAQFGLGWVPDAFAIIVVCLVGVGYVLTFVRNGLHPSHLYILPYLAILTVWPWRGDRFLYGLLPYMIVYILIASTDLLRQLALKLPATSRTWVWRTQSLMLVLWLSMLLARSAMIDQSTDHTPDLRLGTIWIHEHAPKDAVVAAEQPIVAYLYSERATVTQQDITTLEDQACLRPMYALIAPQLTWSNDGNLKMSDASLDLERELQQLQTAATLVYDDAIARVSVFRLHCKGFMMIYV